MGFDDIEVGIHATADTSELRQAIADFDGTEASVRRLQKATQDVKGSITDQNAAIRTLNQAQRVNTFQMLEVLRVFRAATSLFRDLNSVYQTLTLHQIDQNTLTVKQQQAYEDLTKAVNNHVSALETLGPKNQIIDDQFSSILDNADSLNSEQLQDLITNFESVGDKANLSGDALNKYNTELDKLKKLLQETKVKEEQKKWEDLFGIFSAAGTAAGALGTFVLQLAKLNGGLAALGKLARSIPEIGLILTLLFGSKEVHTAGGGEANQPGNIEDLFKQNPNPNFDFGDFIKRFGAPGNATTVNSPKMEINVNNLTLSGDLDVNKWADQVFQKWKEIQGQNRK